MALSPALGAPGVTTTSVNFRSGPGTNFPSIRTLPAGAGVDVGECEDSGSWCAVIVNGQRGFVSGRYLEETAKPEGWPRTYQVGTGRIVLYQPQFTEWADFKVIEALVAAQYVASPDANPVFGVIGLKGATAYDEDAGEIVISDISVTELNFSGLGREELTALSMETGKLLPTGPVTVAEARVAASLAEQKRMADVNGLRADPPHIIVSTSPAILVRTDGPAALAPVKGRDGSVVRRQHELGSLPSGRGRCLLPARRHSLANRRDDGRSVEGGVRSAGAAEEPARRRQLGRCSGGGAARTL